jgi:hypothetical protein
MVAGEHEGGQPAMARQHHQGAAEAGWELFDRLLIVNEHHLWRALT